MAIWKWKGINIIHLKGINTIIGCSHSFIEFIHSRKQGYGVGVCILGHLLEFKVKYTNLNKVK